ncbi:MAG TPA: cell division ATP-binding protein FtsE [Desulfotomaculum sp.]|nr:MAG: putative ATPase [Desulfotomaculum sp. 46_80]HAG11790.1 cell division ATP-binding protein FtsE [Desulfotomaculum sp.]HBY03830.1 cell division ATP-binding protein FtsE [Desulfotomaculum sp.]
MLRFYNVTKTYKNNSIALNNVTLHIKKGEFVFLVGPSGAGKTTLTKLIFREDVPTRGQVVFNGKNVVRMRPGEIPFHRRKIGMVFQDFRLLPQRTIYDNVAFALQVTGTSNHWIKKLAPEALKVVGLEGKAKMRPEQLSGGEQQRVCIARAIVNSPLLLIADEPTGNLDPGTSRELMKLFQDINGRGTTIIMATHAWDIVDSMKKRVVALSGGKVVRDEESGDYHGA